MVRHSGKLISILNKSAQIYLGKALKPYDISAAEASVLLTLYTKDGVTQDDLATRLYLDKSAITRLIQSLLSKNYIIRKKDEHDLRCNRIYITKHALAIKGPIHKALDSWNHILMNSFTYAEQEKIYALLERMVENIKGENK